MASARETACAALAARMQNTPAVRGLLAQDVTRKLPGYSELNPAAQPCLAVICDSQVATLDGPGLEVWRLNCVIVAFALSSTDAQSTAESQLNDIADAVVVALHRQAGETMVTPGQTVQVWSTLGGTVLWARPGTIKLESGQTEEQGIAIIPVEMVLVPS